MKIVDLSHKLRNGMPVYPGSEEIFNIKDLNIYEECGVNVLVLSISGHIGTHLDSPRHLFHEGKDLTELDISLFYGSGIVIDCSSYIENNVISLRALANISNLNSYKFVLLHTNWCQKWGKDEYFENFPVISKELAGFISESDLNGIGVDVCSVDEVDSDLVNHRVILGSQKIIIENLTNLNQIIGEEFIFSCFPLKIKGGDGSPIRATAIIE